MKIAILGSVALPVPPPSQGGTEWIAYYQAEGLAKVGHKVILFAAHGSKQGAYELVEVGGGDTVTGSSAKTPGRWPRDSFQVEELRRASVIPPSRSPFGHLEGGIHTSPLPSPSRRGDFGVMSLVESSRNLRRENVYLAQAVQQLIDRKNDYDIILNNMRGEAVFLPFAPLCGALGKPFVNVMHLPIFPELALLFKQYNTPIITISNAQRKDFPDLNYLATIYNCVDTEKFIPSTVASSEGPAASPPSCRAGLDGHAKRAPGSRHPLFSSDLGSDYLLMMGSISPHKNQAGAIKVAKKLGMKLILAGKINDQKYFDQLKRDIDGKQIRWLGELDFAEKLKLYQNARAFLFPILWEEPFGLVMIEAMACGTPVVAFGNGAIPEVVVDGLTGYVIENNSEEKMTEAVKNIDKIKRSDCRKHVLENFTVEKMIADYEKALLSLL
ncbi:glycosyltransferase family 4 protein [Candidatus Gottesmanbacteria bacterium]|nr:glycosyltransferase family 4 protein [Candidatus Gottesmanbacteria bacterium]